MPYAHRNAQGDIVALYEVAHENAKEQVSVTAPDVQAFIRSQGDTQGSMAYLAKSDVELLRVIEDLVYLLVDKGVIMFTDLPAAVQNKLKNRERARESLRRGETLVVHQDDIL